MQLYIYIHPVVAMFGKRDGRRKKELQGGLGGGGGHLRFLRTNVN